MKKKDVLYVGTYTRNAPFLNKADGAGIYAYQFDAETGNLTYLSEITNVDSPSYLAVDPQHRYLYAVNEIWGWEESIVNAYAIDPESGSLHYLNKQLCGGSQPCYLMVDQTGGYVVVANYESGNVGLFPVDNFGRLQALSDTHQHIGSGPVRERQAAAHAHCAVIDPANRYVHVADLGIDKIASYQLDLAHGKLIPTETPNLTLPAGSGPRHLTFHPNGRFAFVINELNSTISALSYQAEHGMFTIINTVSTLPTTFVGQNHCAELLVSPSGMFLYGSNRGHDSVAMFAIDPASGQLTSVGHQPTEGHTPRNFTIDRSGRYLLVANQDSDNIVTFHIDQVSGLLNATGQITEVPTPVCLKLLSPGG